MTSSAYCESLGRHQNGLALCRVAAHNRYSYALADPINHTDPNGRTAHPPFEIMDGGSSPGWWGGGWAFCDLPFMGIYGCGGCGGWDALGLEDCNGGGGGVVCNSGGTQFGKLGDPEQPEQPPDCTAPEPPLPSPSCDVETDVILFYQTPLIVNCPIALGKTSTTTQVQLSNVGTNPISDAKLSVAWTESSVFVSRIWNPNTRVPTTWQADVQFDTRKGNGFEGSFGWQVTFKCGGQTYESGGTKYQVFVKCGIH